MMIDRTELMGAGFSYSDNDAGWDDAHPHNPSSGVHTLVSRHKLTLDIGGQERVAGTERYTLRVHHTRAGDVCECKFPMPRCSGQSTLVFSAPTVDLAGLLMFIEQIERVHTNATLRSVSGAEFLAAMAE